MLSRHISVFVSTLLLSTLIGCGSGNDSDIDKQVNNSPQKDISIEVSSVNNKPTATFDKFRINRDSSYDGELTAIDSDGDQLQYEIVEKPQHGTITLHDNGCFTYTPDSGYQGSDTFSYRVSDDISSCGVQIVTVDVCQPKLSKPNAPKNLSADIKSTSKIRLSWDGDSSNDGYNIYQDGKLIATTDGDTYKVICGLQPATTYNFEVKAKNEAGTSSASTVQATTKDVTKPPLAPTNLEAKAIAKTSLRLTWKDNSDNESSFEIYQDGIKIKTISSGCNCKVIDGLTEGTTYTFMVKAVNRLGSSDSESINVKTLGGVVELPPVAEAGDDKVINEGESVTLDGSGSSAKNGKTIVEYKWSEGTTVYCANSVTCKIDNLSDGNHTISLSVKDSKGLVASDDVKVKKVENLSGILFYEIQPPFADIETNNYLKEDNKTISGIDTNHNHIRDILELAIYKRINLSENDTSIAVEDYNLLLNALKDIQPTELSEENSIDEHKFYCQYRLLSTPTRERLPYDILLEMVQDTKERRTIYQQSLKPIATSRGAEKCD